MLVQVETRGGNRLLDLVWAGVYKHAAHLDLVDGVLVFLLSGFEQRLGVFNHVFDGLVLRLQLVQGLEEKKNAVDLDRWIQTL